jgi:hypothetical protein
MVVLGAMFIVNVLKLPKMPLIKPHVITPALNQTQAIVLTSY